MRSSRSIVFLLALLVGSLGLYATYRAPAHAQTPTRSTTQTLSQSLSEPNWEEYSRLLKTGATDTALRTWASSNNLRVVSLTRNRLELEPNVAPAPIDPDTVALQACDPKKCAGKYTIESITNTQGVVTQMRRTQCSSLNAVSCKFIPDPNRPGSWLRLCDYRNCSVTTTPVQ